MVHTLRWGNLRERDHLEDPSVDEDNIKMDLQEMGCGARTLSIWLRIGTDGGHRECGNEISGSIKHGEFLD